MNSLETLLQGLGSPEAAEARSEAAFDRIAAPFENRVVIFGTGHLGLFALRGLRAAGIEPLAFCDNDTRRWRTKVEGVPVLLPAEAVARYGDSVTFVVAIYTSSAPRRQLRNLGCTRIVPYPLLFWKHWRKMLHEDRLDLPHRILRRSEEMAAAYELLADEESRLEFLAQIQWRCTLDYDCLPPPDPADEMYYPRALIHPVARETLVDCGAFDGDSIQGFLSQCGGALEKVYALEADPKNVAAMGRRLATFPEEMARRVEVLPYAVSDVDGVARFSPGAMAGSRMEAQGTIEVPCRRLDTVLRDASPTFIKMDIEGAEPAALRGATETMARHRPVMAVCAYHACEHLWTMPKMLLDGCPDYRIYLRRYAEECWELVYYGVPIERVVQVNTRT